MTFPKGYKPPTTNSSTNPSKNNNNNNLPLFHQLNNKGIQCLELGKNNEAISFFQKSLELNPNESNVWFNLGVAFGKLSLFNEALRCLNKSLQINSNNYLALNQIGIIYFNSGKFKESKRYFEKALEINPNNTTTLQNKKIAHDMLWKKRLGIVIDILSGPKPSPIPYSSSDSGVCTCFHARSSHIAAGCTAEAIWPDLAGLGTQCPCKSFEINEIPAVESPTKNIVINGDNILGSTAGHMEGGPNNSVEGKLPKGYGRPPSDLFIDPKTENNENPSSINITGNAGDVIGTIIDEDMAMKINDTLTLNEKIKRYTHATFPSKIAIGDTKPLRVILKVVNPKPPQTTSMSYSVGEISISVSKSDKGIPVLVIVDPDNPKFEVEGDYYKTINVPPTQEDSKPVIFNIKAEEEGLSTIKMEFFQQGDYIGELEVSTLVVSTKLQADVTPLQSIAEGLEFKNFIKDPSSVSLVIFQTASQPKGKYDIIFLSDIHGVMPVGSIELDNDPESKFREIFKDIEDSNLSPQVIDDHISNKGMSLYNELFPPQLKELYWKIRNNIKSIQIYSKEPWIPWEIIKPWRSLDDGPPEEDPFLCEKYIFSRWLVGRRKYSKELLKKIKIIVPSDTELENSINERDWIIENFGHKKGLDVTVDSSYEEVKNTLKTEGYDLIHISSHGKHDNNMPMHSVIELEDGLTIRPENIGGLTTAFGRSHPIVFLNSCQSGNMGFSLTNIQSWVTKFIEAGASVFIGTHWSVNSKTALDFTKEFYSELENGTTIGEAMRVARIKCKRFGDPSWLAYHLYGQPDVQISLK